MLGFKVLCNVFMVEWLNEAGENYRFITMKTIIVRFLYLIGIFTLIKEPDDVIKYTMLIVADRFFKQPHQLCLCHKAHRPDVQRHPLGAAFHAPCLHPDYQ